MKQLGVKTRWAEDKVSTSSGSTLFLPSREAKQLVTKIGRQTVDYPDSVLLNHRAWCPVHLDGLCWRVRRQRSAHGPSPCNHCFLFAIINITDLVHKILIFLAWLVKESPMMQ